VKPVSEAVAALPPEIRRHFGLEGVPSAGRSRPLAELLDLTGRTVLVTGGGGPDLGSALCRRLAGQGALVGVLDVDAAAAKTVAAELAEMTGREHIPLVADVGGRIALRDLSVYNACKAGVIALMRNLAREVGDDGISTVTVCPGGLLGPKLVERMAAWPGPLASAIDQGLAATPLGRFGLPDEVAVAVAFLVSDAGGYINGTELSVGGGQSA
jgi:NAD(P)-dependent dehydrogenase (short-subunit alcohol dehydrogenase family)